MSQAKDWLAELGLEVLEKESLGDLSIEKGYRHLQFLVEEVGERLAGTPEMQKAANYIRSELAEYGLETRIDNFPIYHSYPKDAELRVIWPETKVIAAKPACHSASTLSEGIEGELIYLGVGSYEDYNGRDVHGRIGLVDMTWAPPRPEKARIAYEKGLKGLIIMNWGPLDNPVIQMGGTKSQWGNPTPETFKSIPQIPVISVTRAAGQYLKNLCMKDEVRVWLRTEATREWVKANQPVGMIRGQGKTGEFILVGGHLEAWGKTAVCNSSGNALVLELARVFAKHADKLHRDIIFAFWDGHEVAEAAGSTWFVDTNWDLLTQGCVAYVNIDNPGIRGTSVPGVTSQTELKAFLKGLVKEWWGEDGEWHDAYKGGDASFFGVGVPYISFYTRFPPEKLKELNYASLSPWLHSEADTLDKIDKDLYARHLGFFGLLVARLCNLPVPPYDFVPVAGKIEEDLGRLQAIGKGRVHLDDLMGKARLLREVAKQLNTKKEAVETGEEARLLSKALMKIDRELSHLMWSVAGRYGHDPYGYSLVGEPIPRLYIPITKLAELDEGGGEAELWRTKFIRERSRLADALGDSIDYANLVLSLLDRQEGGVMGRAAD